MGRGAGTCTGGEEKVQTEVGDVVKTFYTASFAPNPMLVDIFMREKGFDPATVEEQVDVLGAGNRSPEMLKKNPSGQVPFIETTSGDNIAETITICEYLEEAIPKPALIGSDAVAKATTRMWQRRMEEHFVYPMFTAFRFWTNSENAKEVESPFAGFFQGRAPYLDGTESVWKGFKEWALSRLVWLEEQKEQKPSDFVCGKDITYVDIQLYTTLIFFKSPGFGEILVDEKDKLPWTLKFMDTMAARPSVKACAAHIAELEKAGKEAAEKAAKEEKPATAEEPAAKEEKPPAESAAPGVTSDGK